MEDQDIYQQNNQSVGTLDDISFITITNMNNSEEGQFLIVQVSIKLNGNEADTHEDALFENIAGESSKFIIL